MIRRNPEIIVMSACVLLAMFMPGCRAPSYGLTFPARPTATDANGSWYDVNGNGRADFITRSDASGKIDAIEYDDDEDGKSDRTYRLGEYVSDRVPHLILLLDSIPYQVMVDRYAAGHFRFADAPRKVICGFPSLTEVCYTEVLRAPPREGMIDEFYDRRTAQIHGGIWQRLNGYEEPWERRLDYHAKFWEGGLSYLHPREWLNAELERVRRAVDGSPNRVTTAYVISASGMACKYGRPGIDEVLDGAERLCLQLFHERQGAIKISIMADHGHNLTPSINWHVEEFLKSAGWNPTITIKNSRDVVVDMHGLVTYCGFHTREPAKLASTLLARDEVELAMYKSGERVVVRSRASESTIESIRGRVRYVPGVGDPLKLEPLLDMLRNTGKMKADGTLSDEDWLSATADAEFPDAPRRTWDAFNGKVVNPPDVMVTLKDGCCAGMPSLERYITMKSTHGSLNQMNSATFVLSMTHPGTATIRSRDILGIVEPGFEPTARR